MSKFIQALMVLCAITLSLLTSQSILAISTPVPYNDYAPYAYRDFYEYLADYMEFSDYTVNLIYPPNAEGIYQFDEDNTAINVVRVYQIAEDGIYELAYFPGEDPQIDYRNHPDATDEMKSLILPSDLTIGTSFYTGYRQEQAVVIQEILPIMSNDYGDYRDVLVISQEGEMFDTLTYLAPNFGIVHRYEAAHDDSFQITTQLVVDNPSGEFTGEQISQSETPLSAPSFDTEPVTQELMAPNILNESLSHEEAQWIVDQILADIEQNHVNYHADNPAALSNMIKSYLPGDFSTGHMLMVIDYFIPYAASLNQGNSSSTSNIIDNSTTHYAVDLAELHGNLYFVSEFPKLQAIELNLDSGQLSYQGSLYHDPGLYSVTLSQQATHQIQVMQQDGNGSRPVKVNSTLSIQSPTAHYRMNTQAAYLFYNAKGGISLALPDFNTELPSQSVPTWIEFYLEP